MSTPKDHPPQNVEVEDAAAAFRKMQGLARRVLGVPKGAIDATAKTKSAKKRPKRH